MTRYRVTGPGFKGHPAGEEFEADLDPDVERRAVDRGAIKKLPTKKPDKEKEEAGDDE